jgi:hypothetical protein
VLVNAFRVQNKVEIENLIKNYPKIKRQIRNIEINGKNKTEIIAYDTTNFTIEKLSKHIKDIIHSKTYSIDNFNRIIKENEELENENRILKEQLKTHELLLKKQAIELNEFREKIERVSSYIRLYQTYLLKIIKKDNFELEKTDFLIKIKDKLNKIPNTSKNKINIFKINSLEKIVDQLYFKIEDDVKFFEINEKILHYFLKNPDLIEKSKDKIILDVFDEKILEPIDKFVEWLLS